MPRTRAPWWMYVVAVSFLGHYVFVTYALIWGVQGLGVNADYIGGRMVLRSVEPGSPAQRAGMQAGDQVVAVDGQAIHNGLDAMAIAVNHEVGRPRQLEIERAGKRMEVTLTLGQRSWREWDATDWTFHLGTRGAQLVLLLLALFIAFSRPHDSVARLGALFLAGVALRTAPSYGMAAIWRHLPLLLGGLLWIAQVGAFYAAPVLFTFFAIFPRILFRARWAWALVWAPGLLVFSALLLYWYRMVYHPEHATGVPDWVLPADLSISAAYILGGLLALVLNYRRLEDINERRRIRVLVVGSVVGWLAILPFGVAMGISSGAFGSFFLSFPVMLVEFTLFMAFPLSFAYTILRHRLFDICIIIRQGLQYAAARGVLLYLVPAGVIVLVLDLLLHRNQALGVVLSERGWHYGIVIGLAFLAHSKRENWMQALDRRFYRERYDAQRLLRDVVEDVGRAGSFERVAPSMVARIEAAFHPEFVALMVREPAKTSYRSLAAVPSGQAPPPLPAESKLIALVRVLGKAVEVSLTESSWLKHQLPHDETDFLRQAHIDLLVPIATSPGSTEALLVLGAKRSEEPYTQEDRDLLVAIAASLALLLEKPAAVPMAGRVSEAFEECPQCGACYDTGAARCVQEGATLTAVRLPRLLAGRYRLERRRGRGGMGAVYEALDTALERLVAAKVIRDDLVGSADAAERFRREARAAASFTHPNAVTVYDFGLAADTRAFLVMELLEGRTLREELLKRNRLTAQRTVGILRGVCAAVEAAHHRKLVHRDLKPENIILAQSGSGEIPKVLDFGIAKFLPATSDETVDTASGVLVGTVKYMAPEQLRGQPVASAWDLWALSVLSYEMLTGAHPFAGVTPAECNTAVLSGRFTPVTTHLPDAPSRWQEFFSRAFSLDVSERPLSAQAFFSQLEASIL